MRILLIDDDLTFLGLLCRSLAELGFEDVIVASSAKQALSKVEACNEPFDCFLFHFTKSDIDGIELRTSPCRREGYPTTPKIMLLSSIVDHHVKQSSDAGATDFFRMPFNTIDMVERVISVMMLAEATKQEKRFRLTLQAIINYWPAFNKFNPNEQLCFCEKNTTINRCRIMDNVLEMHSIHLLFTRLLHDEYSLHGIARGHVAQLLREVSTTMYFLMKDYQITFSYFERKHIFSAQRNVQPKDSQMIISGINATMAKALIGISNICCNNIDMEAIEISR